MINGVLLLHKERGMTSHDCVFKVRKILHTKKSDIQEPSTQKYQVFCPFVLEERRKSLSI